MTLELFLSLLLFCLVTTITPGPNNTMLMTSGANFGFRRTIPHMLGISLGFTAMVGLVGLGLMQVFDAVPYSYEVLTVISVVYLLWLAWKFANAGRADTNGKAAKPMTFLQAAAFQWVNPKAWTMALSAMTLYAPERDLTAVGFVTLGFWLASLPSPVFWAILGEQMQRFLKTERRLTVFNWTMAALLVASIIPTLTS